MYKSPIDLLVADIQYQFEKQQDEEIYKAVLHYVPNVDKEELLRALKYDRNQYDKGYADGKRDAEEALVRCKDCKHRGTDYCIFHIKGEPADEELLQKLDNDFCSYGERRTDNERKTD